MKFLTAFFLLFSFHLVAQVQPLPNAHAHNDYNHERPLLDALDQGFTSVEADIFLIENELYVYHDLPEVPDKSRTLERLYLKPLKKWIKQNKGRVYPGYEGPFYLMIDFKSEGPATYLQLRKLMRKYRSMLAEVDESGEQSDNPVKIFISGKRPIQEILNDNPKLAGLDGRPADLGKGFSSAVMPVVSDNYHNFFTWKPGAPVDEQERRAFIEFVNSAHAEGKKVRLWAAPDHERSWRFLLDCGVDLINTDHLSELREFLLSEKK